jgi:putative hydrolase of the HAD superfamily
MARVRAAGLGIVSWHEERPEVIAGLRARGVDAICTDRPELLVAEDPLPDETSRHILAVCFDFGDTLVDEATEVKDEMTTTQRAALIPGAGEVVLELRRRGYRLALIADGRPGTYFNVLKQHALYGCFDAFAISDYLGVEKPDRRMFTYALDLLGIAPEAYGRTIMVGNYLARDIKGANAAGMISVWLDWAPRRPKVPADASEIPHYRIEQPLELLKVIDSLEQGQDDKMTR